VPSVNASIEGDEIVYHDYLDVSVAVSAPKGLVVPVSATPTDELRRDREDDRRLRQARQGRHADGIEEMQGGTFTISNGGVFGSLLSTPIINPPQSAVLGMHRIEERPVVKDGQIVARPMMYLALELRPPAGRRPRSGDLPGARQGSDRGPDAAADRPLRTQEWLITISTSW
jgi:2-oxoglutarate dehydrogenase E2 component (dihydrolipoamide succinyltransferase)